jgi:murein DD-endopeptidase MepM/ murein hydrolase activator NlpD
MQREREYMSIIYPIKGDLDKQFKITSPFGRRVHPISKRVSNHNGVDLVRKTGKSEGEPIIAPEAGKVIEARKSTAPGGGYGYFVKMQGKSGDVHVFAHMVPKSLKVKRGWVVEQGDVLGLLGNSGASTGPHLHWEVRVRGRFVDPIEWLSNKNKPAPRPTKKPAAKAPAAKPATKQEKFHVVKSGDNLTKIARQYGTTVPTLKKINGITNANLIKVGQLIKLP